MDIIPGTSKPVKVTGGSFPRRISRLSLLAHLIQDNLALPNDRTNGLAMCPGWRSTWKCVPELGSIGLVTTTQDLFLASSMALALSQ
jgi:hypothetical protein